MKKRIFTLFVFSFLLNSVLSNVMVAEEKDIFYGSGYNLKLSLNRDQGVAFEDCSINLSFAFIDSVPSSADWDAYVFSSNPRRDTIVIINGGVEVDRFVTGKDISLTDTKDLTEYLVDGTNNFEVLYRYYTGSGGTNRSLWTFTYKRYAYPTVISEFDGEGIYDYFYGRTTQYQGQVAFTITGGSPELQYHLNNGVNEEGWRKVYSGAPSSKQIKLTAAEIQNLIPGSAILVREPNGCNGKDVLATYEVPQSTFNGTPRPVYLPKVAGATLIPGEGMIHYVPSGKSFSFKIYATGDNAGLKPEVTTEERNIPLPEGEEGITYKQEGEDIWVVTIHGIQEALSVNISFPTTQSSTGNAAVNGNQVWGAEGAAYITSATAGSAGIYSSTGALVKTVAYPAGTTTVPLPAGFYIISQGGSNNYKVIVK
jgi:hypothetical protein